MENLEEMVEKSLKTIKQQTVLKGEIISIANGEIFVNIGYKADGIIEKNNFSYDENKKPEDVYKVGDIIDVFVLKLNDGKGNVQLSLKKLEGEKVKSEFDEISKSGKIISAKVIKILEKGIRVNYNGIEIFIPASHLIHNNLQEYQDKQVSFVIISNEKNRIIGSEKFARRMQREEKAEQLLSNIQVGSKVKGKVVRINEYGAFVDVGGIEGLLHVSQMTWKRNVDPHDFVSQGQELEVEVINIDKENKKIGLRLKNEDENPWNKIGNEIKKGDVVDARIIKILPFGVFVEIIEGLEGFIHISQLSNERVEDPNSILKLDEIVKAKIVKIDIITKKLELSIKALLEEQNKN